jgi:hypothetical protein
MHYRSFAAFSLQPLRPIGLGLLVPTQAWDEDDRVERGIGLNELALADGVTSIRTTWKQICMIELVIEVVKAGPLFMARR